MRSNRPQGAASHPRGHHVRSVLVRVLSVTAMAAAACTLWAGAASAAPTLFGTKTVVTVSPTTADVGATVKLSATVTSPGRIPAGIVTFTWDSFVLCSARTHYGVATCNTTFSLARSYTIKGQFARTRYYWGSYGLAKVTVVNPTKNATTTTITNTAPGSVDVGKTFTFDVTVASAGGSAATGTVVVKPTQAGLPAAFSCTATVTAGKGTCSVTPTEYGILEYTATYGGDATHNGSTYTGPFPLEVKNVTTTTAGPATAAAGTVSLTGSVYAMGANIIDGGGSLAFSNGTTAITGCAAVPLSVFTGGDNVGTCMTTLAAGTYTIKVVYSGDVVNEPSSGTVTLVVS